MNSPAPAFQRTARVPYHCDTDAMIAAIGNAQHELFRISARWPCAVRLHPLDLAALRCLPVEFSPAIHPGQVDRLLNLVVISDAAMQIGEASVERCQASHSDGTDCEHATDPGGHAADAQRRAEAMEAAVARLSAKPAPPAEPELPCGEPATYRQRPNDTITRFGLARPTVRAARWTGRNLNQMAALMGDGEASRDRHDDRLLLVRRVRGGDGHHVEIGQWVVLFSFGELHVMADWAFREHYEAGTVRGEPMPQELEERRVRP